MRALALFSFIAATIELSLASNPGSLAVGIPAAAVFCASLAAATRYPVGAIVALSVTLAAHTLLGSHAVDASGFLLIPFVGTIFIWALRAPTRAFRITLPLLIAGTSTSIIKDATSQDYEVVSSLIFVLLVFVGGPTAAGRILRWRQEINERLERQAEELERNSEARARAARVATRTSSALELHDVIAHEVSVRVVQAGAARRGVERGRADAASSIEAIEATGREGLMQMRRLLGVLRQEDDGAALAPQPTLRRVAGLVEQARQHGLEVHVDTGGLAGELPPGVDVTAYRIAQEALRSATEHGHAGRIDARLATRAGNLEMDLDSDGPIAPATLAGLRQRAEMFGGSLEVRPHGRGGTLRVRIPLDSARAGAPA